MDRLLITINGKQQEVTADPAMPLLWVIRDLLGLTGTKFGCGVAQCGACTVHLNGEAIRSCVTKVSRAAGQQVTTIEGLSQQNDHPLQLAWAELDAAMWLLPIRPADVGRRLATRNGSGQAFQPDRPGH